MSKEPADPRQALVGDLKVQFDLFQDCVKAGREAWAAETLITIRDMAQEGAGLFSGPKGGGTNEPTKGKLPPPTPEQIRETLLKMIGDMPLATAEGPLVCLSFNGHLLTKEKAEHLLPVWMELFKRAHVIGIQETNVDAVRIIGRALKYGLNASHRNEREQACGFLFHPRLQWLGKAPFYHDYLTEVPGHPEYKATLRPAVQQRARDMTTGFVFDVVNMHTKSNLGGPDETRPTRLWQFEALVAQFEQQTKKSPYEKRTAVPRSKPAEGEQPVQLIDLSGWDAPLGPVLVCGDYNAPIESPETTEIAPMAKAGFTCITTPDGRWSYQYRGKGGQFDGWFARGMDGMIQKCSIPKFFPVENRRDSYFYSLISDHLPVFITVNPPTSKGKTEDAGKKDDAATKTEAPAVTSESAKAAR